MKEALFYHKGKDTEVTCALCYHRCTIGEGKRGICGVRENKKVSSTASFMENQSVSQLIPSKKNRSSTSTPDHALFQ